ncbi:MAG: LysR family transcriptional regulator [Pseudomonadota bacterium]
MVQDIRTIGLPALQSFHAVARHGGISAAADHLGMAKSGVSRHVAQLEEQLNVRLLERGARSVRLTPVGAKLDLRIRSILAEVDLLGDIAREESGGVAGQVTVAATPEFGSIIATRLFPALRARHPDLNLVMRPDYAFEDMQDPGTDLAFRIGSFEDDRLVARELGSFRRCLVAAPALAKAANLKRPEDLAGQECMTFRGDRPGATWRFAAKGREVAVDVSGPIAVQNFTILMALALEGQGFALLPDFMIVDALKEGRLVRGLPDYVSPSHPVYLTFRPGARRIARIDATIELADTLLTGFLSEPLSPRQAAE